MDQNQTGQNSVQIKEQLSSNEVEIDLLELLQYFRNRLGRIIISFLVGGIVAGAIAMFLITPKYQATAKLYMVSASSDSVINLSDLNLGTSLSSDYEKLLQARPVLQAVINDLNLDYTYEELGNMLQISTLGDTRILQIVATSIDPEEACDIANSLADKGIEYLPDIMETAEPNLVESAIVPKHKSSPSVTMYTAVGALGCAAVCLGILTIFFLMDDTLKNAESVEKFLGIIPLSVVPEGNFGQEEKKTKRKRKKKKKEEKG